MKSRSISTYLFSSVGVVVGMLVSWFFIPEEKLVVATEKWKGVCWVGTREPIQGHELRLLKSSGARCTFADTFWLASQYSFPNDPMAD